MVMKKATSVKEAMDDWTKKIMGHNRRQTYRGIGVGMLGGQFCMLLPLLMLSVTSGVTFHWSFFILQPLFTCVSIGISLKGRPLK